MPAGIYAYDPRWQIVDTNGLPLVGGYAIFYNAQTTTLAPIYTDATLTALAPNPTLPFDANGRMQLVSYDRSISYKVEVYDINNNLQFTVDNIQDDTSFINVINTQGDLAVGGPLGNATRLPIGPSGYILQSNGLTAQWVAARGSTTSAGLNYLPQQIILSNNIITPATQLDYTSGTFTLSDGSSNVPLAANTIDFTKNGLNGLDNGTLAIYTTYYIYGIINPTTQTTGAIASLSSTGPTVFPSGYTKYGYVGRIITNVSSPEIAGFKQVKNKTYLIPIVFDTAYLPSTPTSTALYVPKGGSIEAILYVQLGGNQPAGTNVTFENLVTGQSYDVLAASANQGQVGNVEILCDDLGQIGYHGNDIPTSFAISTIGWIDLLI